MITFWLASMIDRWNSASRPASSFDCRLLCAVSILCNRVWVTCRSISQARCAARLATKFSTSRWNDSASNTASSWLEKSLINTSENALLSTSSTNKPALASVVNSPLTCKSAIALRKKGREPQASPIAHVRKVNAHPDARSRAESIVQSACQWSMKILSVWTCLNGIRDPCGTFLYQDVMVATML